MRHLLDAMKKILNEGENLPIRKTSTNVALPGDQASRERTQMAARGIRSIPADAMRHWQDAASSGIEDTVDPDFDNGAEAIDFESADGALENHSIEELPTVVDHAVGAPKRLEWHQIKNMPGMNVSAIRGIARQIFGHLTDTPLGDIQTINTQMNENGHVEAMMGWLMKHGEKVDNFDMDLGRIMPGYRATATLYNALGYQFFCMQDTMAEYVYVWPRSDNAIAHQEHLRVEGADPEIAAAYGAFMENYPYEKRTAKENGFGDSAGNAPNEDERKAASERIAEKRAARKLDAEKKDVKESDDDEGDELDEGMCELLTSREEALERSKAARKAKSYSNQKPKDKPKVTESEMSPDEVKIYKEALKDAWLLDTRPDAQRRIAKKALSDYRAKKLATKT
jgi:hypothetical protein